MNKILKPFNRVYQREYSRWQTSHEFRVLDSSECGSYMESFIWTFYTAYSQYTRSNSLATHKLGNPRIQWDIDD